VVIVLTSNGLVFLVDVDNTLLDNDQFIADLSDRLDSQFGETERHRYWSILEARRSELGYVDYLGTLQVFRHASTNWSALLKMTAFLLDYPFSERLYPGALAALQRLSSIGNVAILSDGDIVFQSWKIGRSGIVSAVSGQVMICVHKERELDAMQMRFPAQHYVIIDDKLQLLAAMKSALGARVTTTWVKQGHYAAEAACASISPQADISIARIEELCSFSGDRFDIPDRSPIAERT
jgi:FMN phosphatase YigB (HAD superfamily)